MMQTRDRPLGGTPTTRTPLPRPCWEAEVETLDREALAELQLERLRRQIARYKDRAGFYRTKLAGAGVAAGDLHELSDLSAIPVTTKDELRSEQAEHPPYGSFNVA